VCFLGLLLGVFVFFVGVGLLVGRGGRLWWFVFVGGCMFGVVGVGVLWFGVGGCLG